MSEKERTVGGTIVVVYGGLTPFDALDARIRRAMDASRVRRLKGGVYRATTPAVELVYGEGRTRKEALADLWEWCRWLLADPVAMSFEALGATYTAEVRAERLGGYSVVVPALPGCVTCGETMEEVRANVVEAAEGWLESQREPARVNA